jgi:hypothetical protein
MPNFLLFPVTSTADPPLPAPHWAKVVRNWFECKHCIRGLRTLKIMPRNLNGIVRSWIRLQEKNLNNVRLDCFIVENPTKSKGLKQLQEKHRIFDRFSARKNLNIFVLWSDTKVCTFAAWNCTVYKYSM